MSLRLFLPLVLLFSLGGCFLRSLPEQAPPKKKCHNSKFWDGEQCRN